MNTLIDFHYQRHFKAGNGDHGRGKKRHGGNAAPLLMRVPVGTMVYDEADNTLLCDLARPEEQLVVVHGGDGGRGNATFKTSVNRAPRRHESGWPGMTRHIRLELKLLADVGLIGMPNAGKSTLISAVSAARPKVADYPFTTLVPQLGVVRNREEGGFVIADIPGLIQGASQGRGLGHRFLRHVERCSLLLHLVDLSAIQEKRDPLDDFQIIDRELAACSGSLSKKPRWIAFSKNDLCDPSEQKIILQRFQNFLKERQRDVPLFVISAVTGHGIRELIDAMEKTF